MQAANEGIWEGYDGEWRYVSRLLISMAEAIPADKYSWRPAPGVRSVSEVLMHITQANFYLLSVTGPKMPHELERNDVEKTIVSKPEVVAYLRRSLEAVKTARAQLKPGDLQRKVEIAGETERRWDVLTYYLSRQRAPRPADCICAHEWHRAALVGRCRASEVGQGAVSHWFWSAY
jgi:uncharacterized damage-inducible protein DinB